MAFIGDSIYYLLTNDATVSGLVGDRIYINAIDQEATFPAIAYSIVSTRGTASKSGASTVDFSRIQFDIYGNNFDTVADTAEAVRDLLDFMQPATVAGIYINSISFDSEETGIDEMLDKHLYRMDYIARYHK